jgi:hypothetical protein
MWASPGAGHGRSRAVPQVIVGSMITTLRQKTGSYYWTLPQRRWKATQQVMRTNQDNSSL